MKKLNWKEDKIKNIISIAPHNEWFELYDGVYGYATIKNFNGIVQYIGPWGLTILDVNRYAEEIFQYKFKTKEKSKMKSLINWLGYILVMFTFMFTVSCADDVRFVSPPTPEQIAQAILNGGTYVGPCIDNGLGLQYSYSFNNGSISARISAYTDNTCTTEMFRVDRLGTSSLLVKDSNGNFPINLLLSQYLLTSYDSALTSLFNSSNTCGVDGTMVDGVAFDITAGAYGCLGDENGRSDYYQLINVLENKSQLGLLDGSHDSYTESTRPDVIDSSIEYNK